MVSRFFIDRPVLAWVLSIVAVLAGAPVEIAPTAQAVWMRGASLTMLHQPTPRSGSFEANPRSRTTCWARIRSPSTAWTGS